MTMPSLEDVFRDSDRVTRLKALRLRLARDLDQTASARDVASLSARLLEVDERLAAIDAETPKEEDDLDSLVPAPGAG